MAQPHPPWRGRADQHNSCELVCRHRVNGVGRGGGQVAFNQILTRLHGIWSKSVKNLVKSGRHPLKSCVFRGARRVKSVRPHLRNTPFAQGWVCKPQPPGLWPIYGFSLLLWESIHIPQWIVGEWGFINRFMGNVLTSPFCWMKLRNQKDEIWNEVSATFSEICPPKICSENTF